MVGADLGAAGEDGEPDQAGGDADFGDQSQLAPVAPGGSRRLAVPDPVEQIGARRHDDRRDKACGQRCGEQSGEAGMGHGDGGVDKI